jgi:polysaccharide pyruvyl transferase WcaK-like protein
VIAIKALILAGDTDGNIGDLAIVSATCEHLRSIDPDIEISLLTNFPERDRLRLGIVALKRGVRGLPGLLRAARQSDVVLCGCGGLFQDDDSLLKMPYWALRLLLLRPFAKRIVGLSIGAGPLKHPMSRLFGRLALKALDPISVRDPLALDVLQPLTRKTITVVPDPAFMLHGAGADSARRLLKESGVPAGKRLIGVAVRRWFHTDSNLIPHKYATRLGLHRNRGRQMMSSFVACTTKVLCRMVEDANAHIVFLPTYNVDHENDAAVCRAVAEKLPQGSHTILELDDPALYKSLTGLLDVVLCGRMHPAILAASAGTPVVGMAYNQKFFGMFSLLGQRERCLCMKEFVLEEQTERLTAMLGEALADPDRFRPVTAGLERDSHAFIARFVPAKAVAPEPCALPHPQRR